MSIDQFWENKQDVLRCCFDDTFYPSSASTQTPTQACSKLINSCIAGIGPNQEIYHYLKYSYFLEMLTRGALRLDKAKPFSPNDEDFEFPDVIRNMVTGDLLSLLQQKDTSYIKCFSLDADNEKLWDKASDGVWINDDCVCFKTTPFLLLKSVASPTKTTRALAYNVFKVDYKPWADILKTLNTPITLDSDDLTIRRLESITTLPSIDANGESTSYLDEHEVRFVYEKLKRRFSSNCLWHPFNNTDFITDVRLSCSADGVGFAALKNELVTKGKLNASIIRQR